jgi:N-acetylmuramoyl-L-alanine amidase
MLPGNRLDALNVLLAWSVHLRIVNTLGTEDRAVKRARFAVLKSLNCPGILVEGGFISSQTEGAQIANPNYRQKLAESVAAGIIDYINRLKP